MAAASCDLMNWYAVHTKPRQESLAQTSLEREGIETFFPKLKRKRTIRRVRRWVTGALFPNYLFARFDAERSGRLVKYANGVINIVSFGGKPAVVDDAVIAAIAGHSQDDVITITPPQLKPGDIVEIQEGPLRGLQGVFEREMSDRDRVVVLLEVIAKGARVQVTRDQLERILE
jgi:transcriptional antiterminator RfaH